MNNDIKVNLTITLKGSVIMSKEECLKTIQKEITKKNPKNGKIMYKKIIDIQVEDWDKMDKHTIRVTNTNGTNPEIITFHTRKCIPATQSLNISKEAYEYMIDKDSCPSWINPSRWSRMSKKEKLEAHLQKITEYLEGVSYVYQIFED